MIKEVAEVVGILAFMVLIGYVPASDLPKQVVDETPVIIEEEIIEEAVDEPITEEIIDDIEEFEEADEEVVYADEDVEEWVYLGAYDITAYEWTGYPCANGNYPTEGYTVACNSLPLGTLLYIDGIGYRTVEDRGADWHSDYWIDLYLGDVSACFEWGIRTRDVWIVQ